MLKYRIIYQIGKIVGIEIININLREKIIHCWLQLLWNISKFHKCI